VGLIFFAVSLAIVALALAEIIIFVSRFPVLGLWLVLLVFLGVAFAISLPEFSLGFITAYPQDIVFIVLAISGMVRLIMRKRFSYVHVFWLFLGFLMMISFTRGVAGYGLYAAGVELREFFYFFAGALYFMNFPTSPDHIKRLALIWLYVAAALLLLALFRWVAWGAGLGIAQQWAESGRGGLRVLNAAQALFLIQAFLISLYLKFVPNSPRLWRSFSGALLPVVVVLQHRTVWVVALVSILLATFQEERIRSRVLYILTGAIVMGAVLGLVVFGENIGKISDSLSASTTEAFSTGESTFMWRVESWKALLIEKESSGYINYFLGKPFGAGYVRDVWGFERTETPHNYYIQVILRLGAFGLIALFSTYAILIRSLMQPAPYKAGGYFNGRLVSILLITQLIFFITYSPNFEQGIILGLAMALSIKRDENESQDEQVRGA